MPNSDAGTSGYILKSLGANTSPVWVNPTSIVTSPSLSSLTAATGTNDINNAANAQTWRWNSKNDYGIKLMSTTTTDVNTQALLHVELDGANGSSSRTTYGASISNGHTGTTSTNVALNLSASAGTVNNALNIAQGAITLNGSAGTSGQVLTSAGANTLPTWETVSVTASNTATITNKRWVARVGSTTSSATPTINTDNYDIYKLTAQAADITSFTTNLSGTPNDGDILEIQITGTAARAITWGSSFVSTTVTLPATTVTTATMTVILQYYTTSSYGNNKWQCVNYY